MKLAELGSLLEKKRQSKNLSFDDVSKAIKIPVKSLIALEHGDMEHIGYETYYKNFLKCYAMYLGWTLEEYQEAIKEVEEFSEQIEPPKSLEAQLAENQPELTKSRGKKLAVQLVILAVIGGSAYFYLTSGDFDFMSGSDAKPQTEIAAQAPKKPETAAAAVKEETAEPIVLAETNETAKSAETQAETAVQESQTAKNQSESEKVQDNSAVPVQNDAGLVEQKMPSDEKEENPAFDIEAFLKDNPSAKVIDWSQVAEPKEGEQQAVIHAKQDCWMQYTEDGKSSHFTLKRGEQRVFNFKKSLSFRIANGSAITLYYNKKPVTVGDSSKVREIVLK